MSDNLDLPVMTENQTGKEVTFNDALAVVDAVLTEIFAADVTSGNVSLTNDQFRQQQRIHISGAATAGRNVTVPAIKRGFLVTAAGANVEDANLVRGSTSIAIEPGSAYQCFTDGTTNGLLAFPLQQPSSGLPHDFQFFVSGVPGSSEICATFTATRAFTLPEDLVGSLFKAKVAADASTVFDVQKNSVSFGDITFAASGDTGTADTTAASFAIGDVLDIVAPASQDDLLADITFAFVGERA